MKLNQKGDYHYLVSLQCHNIIMGNTRYPKDTLTMLQPIVLPDFNQNTSYKSIKILVNLFKIITIFSAFNMSQHTELSSTQSGSAVASIEVEQ